MSRDGADAAVKDYLTAMGVGDPVMAIMRKTPAASVHWLSLADLRASRLATLALDAAEPILTSGANGLNAHAFEGDPPPPDLLQARVAEPLALPIKGRGVMLEIAFSYRRGGGAVEAEVTAREADTREAVDPPDSGWSLTLDGGRRRTPAIEDGRAYARARDHPARALLRARPDGELVAEPIGGTRRPAPGRASRRSGSSLPKWRAGRRSSTKPAREERCPRAKGARRLPLFEGDRRDSVLDPPIRPRRRLPGL